MAAKKRTRPSRIPVDARDVRALEAWRRGDDPYATATPWPRDPEEEYQEVERRSGRYNRSGAPMEAERLRMMPLQLRELLARGQGEPIVLLRGDVVVYRYMAQTPARGESMLAGVAFVGKSLKPSWRFLFRSEAEFDRRVLLTVESRRARKKVVRERKVQAMPEEMPVVGQVFDRSWGYDQTNVDFYEVLSVSPSGKTVKAAKITKQILGTSPAGGPSDSVVALPTRFGGRTVGPTFLAHVRRGYRGQSMITLGRGNEGDHATLWDGQPMHETGSGWGH